VTRNPSASVRSMASEGCGGGVDCVGSGSWVTTVRVTEDVGSSDGGTDRGSSWPSRANDPARIVTVAAAAVPIIRFWRRRENLARCLTWSIDVGRRDDRHPRPRPGRGVVAVQACGVCHTDLHYREGGINDDFPFLLGHEAAGVVESVGEGVTNVQPGDFVILNWRAVCGNCRSCLRGRAVAVLQHLQRHPEDDAGGRHRAVARRSASAPSPTRRSWPPASAPRSTPRRPAAAGLLGCGVMAGIGAAINTGNVPWRLVAVFGCGGVGDAAIAGARWRARAPSSPSTSTTGSWSGPSSSAPRTPSTRRPRGPGGAIKSVTGGNGADVCIEAVGHPPSGSRLRRPRPGRHGRAGRRAAPRHEAGHCRSSRCSVVAGAEEQSWYGDCLPVARLPDAGRRSTSRAGSTSTSSSPRDRLDDVEEAFHKMERGEVLR
jgi:S-(hydroxymethyl)mycothiol dehydrogenase